jgi:hypothetical protein
MLSGFNTNFRYRGVLFHVQTEDSGRDNPHVITHLFHGGNIIASEKADYRDLLDGSDIEASVKKLMESQHRTILKQLSRGEHDRAIGERLGPDIFKSDGGGVTDSSPAPSVTEEQAPSAGSAKRSSSPAMAEPTVVGSETLLPEPPEPPETASPLSRVFGERVVSEKPLDEVVLDYLVENARKRKRQPK